jgi:hypothetical protein
VLCSDPIRKGDSYWRISVVFDGRARTIKRCVRCQHLHVHLRELCQAAGDAYSDMWPDERLACGLDYSEEWGPIPQEIAALAFWKPGEPLPCALTARCQRGELRWEHWPARTPNPCTEAA